MVTRIVMRVTGIVMRVTRIVMRVTGITDARTRITMPELESLRDLKEKQKRKTKKSPYENID